MACSLPCLLRIIENMNRSIVILLNTLIVLVLAVIFVIIMSTVIIDIHSKGKVFNKIEKLPENKTGLVLGTSRFLRDGTKNPYFEGRMNAAAELYFAGKVKALILSGDNATMEYNEPMIMKRHLLMRGVPDSIMYLDYAGFRTLDAVVRAKEIFRQDKYTIISQEFHSKRAVFIAYTKDIDAVAYNAFTPKVPKHFSTNLRESFARVKVFIDLLTNKQPKFLGDSIEIKEN